MKMINSELRKRCLKWELERWHDPMQARERSAFHVSFPVFDRQDEKTVRFTISRLCEEVTDKDLQEVQKRFLKEIKQRQKKVSLRHLKILKRNFSSARHWDSVVLPYTAPNENGAGGTA